MFRSMPDDLARGRIRVSVVIATLGGNSLKSTIDQLNAGSVAPDEILVCIPEKESHRLDGYTQSNVKVVVTGVQGQVAQRSVGFRMVSNELVMQLDDDVLLEENCLQTLVAQLEQNGPCCAIAPALRWLDTRKSVYKTAPTKAWARLFYWCVNGTAGYHPGAVTKAGTEIGLSGEGPTTACAEAQWLPGGCILHRRRNLVLDDFYPFSGKAFCEDLIHSHLLRQRAVRLIVSNTGVAYLTNTPTERLRFGAFLRALKAEARARRYYVALSSRSVPRMYFYYLARLFKQAMR
jgi:hypothetical protein